MTETEYKEKVKVEEDEVRLNVSQKTSLATK
jgi:hypothetical protein